MSLINDIVKIHLSSEGYLPNYPYHMISDDEMYSAFLDFPVLAVSDAITELHPEYMIVDNHYEYPKGRVIHDLSKRPDISYFLDKYPCSFASCMPAYTSLIENILNTMRIARQENSASLPDWVYEYMLGRVVGPDSDKKDIHDLLVSMSIDNIEDEFTEMAMLRCYSISLRCIALQTEHDTNKSPTVFGDKDVLKYIRAHQAM